MALVGFLRDAEGDDLVFTNVARSFFRETSQLLLRDEQASLDFPLAFCVWSGCEERINNAFVEGQFGKRKWF